MRMKKMQRIRRPSKFTYFVILIGLLVQPLKFLFPTEIRAAITYKPSIFFGFVSTGNPKRVNFVYNNWLHKLQPPHNYAFISKNPNKSKLNFILPYHKYIVYAGNSSSWPQQNIDRAAKRMTGLEYFLYNTTNDYYWSLTDDVPIDIDNMEHILKHLQQNYLPLNESVFIGHSLQGWFIQGGTGFLLSRYGAKLIIDHGVDWVKNITVEDDKATLEFRPWLGVSKRDTYSSLMFGEEPYAFNHSEFWNDKLPKCKRNHPKRCSENYKITDLHALHTRFMDAAVAMENLKQAKKIATDLYFYYCYMDLYLCKGEPYNREFDCPVRRLYV